MLRVLALVPYPTGRVPGQRFRIEQWAPLLREQGLELTFAPFLSPRGMDALYAPGRLWTKARETLLGYASRVRELFATGGHDVAYVYREAALLGPAWLERLFDRRLPLVYDFDDAIYLREASPANAWAAALKFPGKVRAACRLARHVIAGSPALAQFASAHNPRVSVVPSTIDTGAYTLRPRAPNARPVVGWTGSLTTLPHLRSLGPALARLRAQVDFELRVIGGAPELPGVDVRGLPWRAESEADDLRPIDVGVMPLPDDAWSRGKCGMKALQYMALGIPPVVTPVGASATIVRDGVNGLHARGEDEWVERLARLLRDPELRARLGAEARRTVEREYSADVHAPRVAGILREVAAERAGGA